MVNWKLHWLVLGEITKILVDKGDVDQAIRLHQERLKVYESLGDLRSRPVTLGDIAAILVSKDEIDRALALQTESLEIYKTLVDIDGKASALWSIAKIKLGQNENKKAFEHMSEAYGLLQSIGKLQAIVVVGITYGHFLCAVERSTEGLAVLERSLKGLQKLGQHEEAEQLKLTINRITSS